MKQRDSGEPPPEKNDPVHEQRNSTESTNPGKDIPPPTIVVPPSPQGPQSPEDKNEARERRAERRDRMRLGVEIFAIIVGLVGIGGLFVTFRETQETNRIARRTLEIQERPWISVDVNLSSPVIFYKDGSAEMEVSFSLKNVGHSVATHVWEQMQIVPFSAPDGGEAILSKSDETERLRNELCEKVREMADLGSVGFVLFPEQEIVLGRKMSVARERVKEKSFTQPDQTGLFVDLIMIGCVAYRPTLFPGFHVTGFVYSVSSVTQAGWHFRVGETVPSKNVMLTPYPLVGTYID